jgi:hypothetical protein
MHVLLVSQVEKVNTCTPEIPVRIDTETYVFLVSRVGKICNSEYSALPGRIDRCTPGISSRIETVL